MEVEMEVDPVAGDAVPINVVIIVVPSSEAEIEGILLGRNVLLHHGFSIVSIPNRGLKGLGIYHRSGYPKQTIQSRF